MDKSNRNTMNKPKIPGSTQTAITIINDLIKRIPNHPAQTHCKTALKHLAQHDTTTPPNQSLANLQKTKNPAYHAYAAAIYTRRLPNTTPTQTANQTAAEKHLLTAALLLTPQHTPPKEI
jgi:hypothetical protein